MIQARKYVKHLQSIKRKKTNSTYNSISNKNIFLNEGDIKKPRKFITSRPAVQEILKENPLERGKMISDGNLDQQKG